MTLGPPLTSAQPNPTQPNPVHSLHLLRSIVYIIIIIIIN